ncbi:MAG: hypothetical protein ACP5TL_01045 [Candidatus Micrarchaeia archaeon]
MKTKNLGVGFFITGLVLLLFTFYLAYDLYAYLIEGQPTAIPQNTTSSNSTANNIAQAITSSIISAIPINKYASIFLGILVLYVLANVSYKIAKLGLETMNIGISKSNGSNGDKQK